MPAYETTAARFLASNLPVATPLSAREIAEHVPQALRDSSVFSARTIYAEHLSETQRDIATMLDGRRVPAEIRVRMKLRLEKLGYEPDPAKRGGLQDLSSDMRTNLIISMQESRARGFAVWRSHQNQDIMDAWPAQELYRAISRKKPRDWQERWNDARASLGEGVTSATYAVSQDGPFVALKNDPIWTHPSVSRFGTPYTPFDYESGMRLRNVTAEAAREMKVLTDERQPEICLDPMNQMQSSSAAGMDPSIVRAWVEAFGDRARVVGTRVAVAPPPSVVSEVADAAKSKAKAGAPWGFVPRDVLNAISKNPAAKPLPPETVFYIDADAIRHIEKAHGAETRAEQRPVTRADIDALPATVAGPGRWRASTDQEKGAYQGDAVTFISDYGHLVAFRVSSKKARLSVHTMHIRRAPDRTDGRPRAAGPAA
jgi:hypothetical protein